MARAGGRADLEVTENEGPVTTVAPITVEGRRILSTLNEDGSRRWIKPRLSLGRFLSSRRAVAWLLIAVFTAAPYLRMHGKPMFLLDLATRRFTLFGRTFLPTDTVLLALFMVGAFVTIFLLTALFGRVWCGWACPQTVYMEFVYRPLERLFEGAPGRARKGLAATPAGTPLKLAAYLLVSMFLAHTFLAWFVGVDRLLVWVRHSPVEHPGGFIIMAAVTGLMLFDFGYFREQTCLVACPYGRFQSALLDRDSLVISYDRARGEPRGKKKAGPAPIAAQRAEITMVTSPGVSSASAEPGAVGIGDCVDCGLCVATCPTGIDIRDGLQMECIGCAQCIDACDAVMTKLKRPIGLIRYSSQSAVAGERRRSFRPRLIVYPIVLLVVAVAFVLALAVQGPADVTVLRGLGRPFTELAGGEVANQVRIKIVNRTEAPHVYLVKTLDAGQRIVCENDPINVAGGSSATIGASIIAPRSAFDRGSGAARLQVSDDAGFSCEVTYRLIGPVGSSPSEPAEHDEHAEPGEHAPKEHHH